ncbi:MAG: hypothetical protein ACLP9L_21515, partial [Thermoguttaceae bacterium]
FQSFSPSDPDNENQPVSWNNLLDRYNFKRVFDIRSEVGLTFPRLDVIVKFAEPGTYKFLSSIGATV